MKKKVLLTCLLAASSVFAAKHNHSKISASQREALRSQSPSVKVHSARHEARHQAKGRTDRAVSDKTTINAYVPVGK